MEYQAPLQVVQQAVDTNVHSIAISTDTADDGHKIIKHLKERGRGDVVVSMCLQAVSSSDLSSLLDNGISPVFGPGIHEPLREIHCLIRFVLPFTNLYMIFSQLYIYHIGFYDIIISIIKSVSF